MGPYSRSILRCSVAQLVVRNLTAISVYENLDNAMNDEEQLFAQAQDLYRKERFSEAFQLYMELANRGRVGCQRFVGWMYFCGEGVDKDFTKAFEWFKKAAANGDREAKFGAGRVQLLLNNDTVAFDWFSQACKEGFVPGCFRVGWMLRDGRGCQQSLSKSYDVLRKAYESGHLPAGRAIAVLLIRGHEGFVGRLKGVSLMVKVFTEITALAVRDPKSQRFMS